MSVVLPRFVVLQQHRYNNKYLRYVHEDGPAKGHLQFSGEDVMLPYSKFQVQTAESDGGLVHLRCCYNNKYLVAEYQNDSDLKWVLAKADEPEEDQSKKSCTLFKPVYEGGDLPNNLTVRFQQVHSGFFACSMMHFIPADLVTCLALYKDRTSLPGLDVFTIIDWETFVVMPKHVAFIGDNGKSLVGRRGNRDIPYEQFSGPDVGDRDAGHEIHTNPDGSICIKSYYYGKFWRRANNTNWIHPDVDDTTATNLDTSFWPIKLGDDVIALRNLGNNNFCERHSTQLDGLTDDLNAAVSTITTQARLQVAELVLSRSIYDVTYHLKDARIYQENIITMGTGGASNTTNQDTTLGVTVSYTDTKSSTWNASVSLTLGVKATFEANLLFVGKTGIETSVEFTGAYEWGGVEEFSSTFETVYQVTVPPMTKATVLALGTRGSCDVPFSYTQHDILNNGQPYRQRKVDGIYTGISSYNVHYDVIFEKINSAKLFIN